MFGQKRQADAYNSVQNAQARELMRTNNQMLQLREQERARQQALQGQSRVMLNGSINNNSVASQNAQEAQMRQGLSDQYSQSADSAADPTGIPGFYQTSATADTPKVVADTYKNAFAHVGNYLRQQAGSKAALDAYGNSQGATTIANARQLQQQGLLGNFMQGSSSVLANELAANSENSQLNQMKAARAGDNASQQAAIFNGLGGLGMNLGSSGLMGGLGSAAAAKAPFGASFTPQLGLNHLFTPKAGAIS
jgi:hypothetical protein